MFYEFFKNVLQQILNTFKLLPQFFPNTHHHPTHETSCFLSLNPNTSSLDGLATLGQFLPVIAIPAVTPLKKADSSLSQQPPRNDSSQLTAGPCVHISSSMLGLSGLSVCRSCACCHQYCGLTCA